MQRLRVCRCLLLRRAGSGLVCLLLPQPTTLLLLASLADVLDDLSEHDALFITEEDAYERCQDLARWAANCTQHPFPQRSNSSLPLRKAGRRS